MTRDLLRRRLAAAGLAALPLEEPAALLRAVEAAADARPHDRRVADALFCAHGYATAGDGVPLVVGGVRRERLVRWDAFSSTWDGTRVATGQPARVRAPATRDPVLGRALVREGRALGVEIAGGALVAVLPGPPLSPVADRDDREDPDVLVRLLGSGLAALAAFERDGRGLPELAAEELHDVPGGLAIVCLTRGEAGDSGGHVAHLARCLAAWWDDGAETPVDALLEGLACHPPTAAEALSAWQRAIAVHLAGIRHGLARRHESATRAVRRERLTGLVERLGAALPPPDGRGSVGVDLDGRPTVVVGAGGALSWGPIGGAQQTVYSPRRGISPQEGARLLRARAAAPPNPRLAADVAADVGFTEAACRWVVAALALRMLRSPR